MVSPYLLRPLRSLREALEAGAAGTGGASRERQVLGGLTADGPKGPEVDSRVAVNALAAAGPVGASAVATEPRRGAGRPEGA